MRWSRGFKLDRKLKKFFKWAKAVPRRTKPRPYQRLDSAPLGSTALSKLCNWGRSLKRGAVRLCFSNCKPGYIRMGPDHDQFDHPKPAGIPKGHLAVYVGEKEDDAQRYLIPVIYFNHPLFGNLLRQTEKEFGFHYPGGIQIPCRVSEFEKVKTTIAATDGGRHRRLCWLPRG